MTVSTADMDESNARQIEKAATVKWEYGFYDSEQPGTPFWYLFGLPFTSAEQAIHAGSKNVWGRVVVVRRPEGSTDWHRYTEPTGA